MDTKSDTGRRDTFDLKGTPLTIKLMYTGRNTYEGDYTHIESRILKMYGNSLYAHNNQGPFTVGCPCDCPVCALYTAEALKSRESKRNKRTQNRIDMLSRLNGPKPWSRR